MAYTTFNHEEECDHCEGKGAYDEEICLPNLSCGVEQHECDECDGLGYEVVKLPTVKPK